MTKKEVTKETLAQLDKLYGFLLDETPTGDMDEAEQATFQIIKNSIGSLRSNLMKTETLR